MPPSPSCSRQALTCDRIRAQHAAGAGLVLHHEDCPDSSLILWHSIPRERIGGAAGRKAVDMAHRARRPVRFLHACPVDGMTNGAAAHRPRTKAIDGD